MDLFWRRTGFQGSPGVAVNRALGANRRGGGVKSATGIGSRHAKCGTFGVLSEIVVGIDNERREQIVPGGEVSIERGGHHTHLSSDLAQ